MKPEGSSTWLREQADRSSPEPDESIPRHNMLRISIRKQTNINIKMIIVYYYYYYLVWVDNIKMDLR
jgi:hypothetical protein